MIMASDEASTSRSTRPCESRLAKHSELLRTKSLNHKLHLKTEEKDIINNCIDLEPPLNMKLEDCISNQTIQKTEPLQVADDVAPTFDPLLMCQAQLLDLNVEIKEEPLDLNAIAFPQCVAVDPLSMKSEPEEIKCEEPLQECSSVLEDTKEPKCTTKNRTKSRVCSQHAAKRIKACISESSQSGNSSPDEEEPKSSDSRREQALKKKQRRANETPEERELRCLQQRITTIKTRLRAALNTPAEELEAKRASRTEKRRQQRHMRREVETPEEREERKRKNAQYLARRRKFLEVIEMPEETQQRKREEYQRRRKLYLQALSQLSEEERAERRKRSNAYRQKYRQKSTKKNEMLINSIGS